MQKGFIVIILSVLALTMTTFCTGDKTPKGENAVNLYYNQVGYIYHGPKLLLVAESINRVIILDQDGNEVFAVTPEPALYWEQSGDAVRKVDFSHLTKKGNYTVVLPEVNEKHPLKITERPFTEVAKAGLKAFYFNRTAIPIEPQYGGKWARPAGHPDTIVYVHSSAADENRPEGTIISSPLGWYDAGDYNKYIVNSGITTYTMFKALHDYAEYFRQLDVNIPETGSGVPDLLSEIMFNYKWMLTMQDPHDGGVYHKLTNKNFDGIVMPHEATNDRYVVAKSTTAALNFAAVAAKAYRVLQDYERHYPGIAEKGLRQAERAMEWALNNPDVPYIQPEDIHTGAYGDREFGDEFFWAAAELWLSTGKEKYVDIMIENYRKPTVPTWQDVMALGFISLLDDYNKLPQALRETGLRDDFFALVDELTTTSKTSPYGVSIENFVWGSNSSVANEGFLKLTAYRLTGKEDYLHSALSDMDYILGRNATGYCFVTGFGQKKVMNIHHRPSEADDVEDPVPGFLAGGPNTSVFTDCPPEMERSQYPAKSFIDHWCSYSTNEIAINWNAPLVYLSGALDALMKKD